MKHIQTFESFLNEATINEDALDKIAKTDVEKIKDILNDFRKKYLDRPGVYWGTLFDPVQTHAIYGLKNKDSVNSIKKMLANLGAKKFRVVGGDILCFDATKMV